jgi:hypothetical protein
VVPNESFEGKKQKADITTTTTTTQTTPTANKHDNTLQLTADAHQFRHPVNFIPSASRANSRRSNARFRRSSSSPGFSGTDYDDDHSVWGLCDVDAESAHRTDFRTPGRKKAHFGGKRGGAGNGALLPVQLLSPPLTTRPTAPEASMDPTVEWDTAGIYSDGDDDDTLAAPRASRFAKSITVVGSAPNAGDGWTVPTRLPDPVTQGDVFAGFVGFVVDLSVLYSCILV